MRSRVACIDRGCLSRWSRRKRLGFQSQFRQRGGPVEVADGGEWIEESEVLLQVSGGVNHEVDAVTCASMRDLAI